MTQETTLTAAVLQRLLPCQALATYQHETNGQTDIQVEVTGIRYVRGADLTYITLHYADPRHDNAPTTSESLLGNLNLRPLLRQISAITDTEAALVFMIAFDCLVTSDEIEIERNQAFIRISDNLYRLLITYQGKALPTYEDSSARRAALGPVFDHLDSIGIDTRGLIQRGLAVDAATLT